MTDIPGLDTADYRRAVSLVRQRALAYGTGILAVAEDSGERTTQLFIATLETYETLLTQLRTPEALHAVRQLLEKVAAEDPNEHWRWAAAITLTRQDDNADGCATLWATAVEQNRAGHLLGALLDVHAMVLPELCTPSALDGLARWCAQLYGDEQDG